MTDVAKREGAESQGDTKSQVVWEPSPELLKEVSCHRSMYVCVDKYKTLEQIRDRIRTVSTKLKRMKKKDGPLAKRLQNQKTMLIGKLFLCNSKERIPIITIISAMVDIRGAKIFRGSDRNLMTEEDLLQENEDMSYRDAILMHWGQMIENH